ncbi:hypothetical protein F4809DRAFT_467712 [Biscogniauxia mediterranea]|nr:hypothetical protein F4809DRAFT_467712 [Biscogniauxia mediterranea]
MTRTKMPLTPASSTEIKGQDHSSKLSSLQLSFELPPSAMGSSEASSRPSSSGLKMSPVSPPSKPVYPVQPSETVKSRRRPSAAPQKEAFTLPPPPTRSRKIIQVKPRTQQQQQQQEDKVPESRAAGPGKTAATAASGKGAGSGAGAAGSNKKKQPSATSAAGRKIARKTAHSLIERRRRSKMNEEFAVLKGLIPACTGDMHKLAILQASIEYIRYLEECVAQLKARHPDGEVALPPQLDAAAGAMDHEMSNADPSSSPSSDEDVEMTDSEATTTSPALTRAASQSPVLAGQGQGRGRQHSCSSSSTSAHYGLVGGGYPPPQSQQHQAAQNSRSALTSPALRPQQELDQEASAAALLMLNADRRGVGVRVGVSSLTGGGGGGVGGGGGGARGMSVRDLLSS